MSESAGAIYAEIKLALDTLQVDVNKAKNMFSQLGTKVEEQNQKISKSTKNSSSTIAKAFTEMSNNGINQFAKMASGIQKTVMAMPIIGLITMVIAAITKLVGGISDYLNKTAEAYYKQQKELTTLNTLVETTGATAWTSANQLNSMAASLSKTTGFATNDITAMQSRILTYTNIIGDNFDRTQKAAINMASVMGMDLTSAAETLGKALDSPAEGLNALTRQGFRFKSEMKEQIKLMVEQGNISQAQALILKEVENSYGGVAEAQAKVVNKSERLKQVQEQLNAEIGKSTSAFKNFFDEIRLAFTENKLFEMQQKRMSESVEKNEKAMDDYISRIRIMQEEFDRIGTGERKLKLKDDIEKAVNELDKLQINPEIVQERVDFWNGELKRFDITKTMNVELTKEEKEYFALVQSRLILAQQDLDLVKKKQDENAKEIEHENKIKADKDAILKIEKEVTEATEKRKNAIKTTNFEKDKGRISEEERDKKVMQAYTEEANTLTKLKQQMTDLKTTTDEGAESKIKAINKANDALQKSIDLEKQERTILADKAMEKVYQDQVDGLLKLKGTTEQIRELEKTRAWEAIENNNDYIHSTDDMKKKVKQAFDDLWSATDKKDIWNRMKEGVKEYGQEAVKTLSQLTEFYNQQLQKQVAAEIESLEKIHNAKLEYFEKEKQRKLYEKGYIEAQTEEQHQRELELAIESGDQQRIYEAHSNHEKFLIEQDYLNNVNAANEEFNREKAKQEYRAALAQWQTQLLNSIASGALSVTMAGINTWPLPAVPMMAMAATNATIQQGILLKNKPKMQTFSGGGIVEGSSFSGDNKLVWANSDEMFLNRHQQKNLFNKINNDDLGSEKNITITIPVYLDGKIIASNTVEHINNRQTDLIDNRSIS